MKADGYTGGSSRAVVSIKDLMDMPATVTHSAQ